MSKRSLYLVDGSSYLFRAFHALPPLTNSAGEPTGAMFGVANMLRKALREEEHDFQAVVFDAPGKTFRHDMYPEYKANRPPMPEELRSQIAPLKALIRAMGVPLVEVKGVEADDVIGTLTRQATAAGIETVVSTSDKDLAQLVDDHVTLVNTMSNTRMDEAGVKRKFDVIPEQIIDYLALVGDSVDNIPGVPKVGPKTAAKWLARYGSLDGVIEHAAEIGGKVGQYLRDAIPELPLSRNLVTIKTDVPLDCEPQSLTLNEGDEEALRELCTRYEFNAWLSELGLADSTPEPARNVSYETIATEQELAGWVDKLAKADLICLDTETTSLNALAAELVGIALAVEPDSAAYIPVGHVYPGAPEQLDREAVLEALRPVLEDAEKPKVGQHIKYDANVLAGHGVAVRGIAFDTMLESYVLNSTATRHDMDSLALKYLGRETIHYEDVAGKGAKQISFAEVPVETAAPYSAEDADITLQLHLKLWPQLERLKGQRSVFKDIEMPLVPVLAEMERHGVLLDADQLARQSGEINERLGELETRAHELAEQPFNLGSPKQLQQILFEKQELPVIRKTPKGQPSTAEDVLQELARDYELPSVILEHRSLSKLKGTYTDQLPKEINPRTGRVHTSYHQAVAATGRLSSSDPNLQNIPIRTEEGRKVRKAFVAPRGWRVLAADYSQIELRIMAHLSEDEGLIKAFREGVDIHSATAAEVFGGDPEKVSSEQRRAAKAINFGLMYGMSAYGLARRLEIARGEAQEYIDTYFARFSGVREFMEKTRKQAGRDGYVETLFGRRLYLNEINSRNGQRRQAAERAAINAPMQGTAADIIKRAMLAVHAWMPEIKGQAHMIMQVHDELVFEVHRDQVETLRKGVIERMESAADLKVPLIVDVGVGMNWDEAH